MRSSFAIDKCVKNQADLAPSANSLLHKSHMKMPAQHVLCRRDTIFATQPVRQATSKVDMIVKSFVLLAIRYTVFQLTDYL